MTLVALFPTPQTPRLICPDIHSSAFVVGSANRLMIGMGLTDGEVLGACADHRIGIPWILTCHGLTLLSHASHNQGSFLPTLLLDSGVVDLPMSYNPIVVTLSSLKAFFFNGFK